MPSLQHRRLVPPRLRIGRLGRQYRDRGLMAVPDVFPARMLGGEPDGGLAGVDGSARQGKVARYHRTEGRGRPRPPVGRPRGPCRACRGNGERISKGRARSPPLGRAASILSMPLDDQGAPPGVSCNLRPQPVAGRAVTVVHRRPEKTQAGDPEGELLGDRPRDDHPIEPPECIAPAALPEVRIVGGGHGRSSLGVGVGQVRQEADPAGCGRNLGRPAARSGRGCDSSSFAMVGAGAHGLGAVPPGHPRRRRG